MIFIQIAEGVDDETWNHHLRAHDYSPWIETSIKDHDLTAQLRLIEDHKSPAQESRKQIAEAILAKYSVPE